MIPDIDIHRSAWLNFCTHPVRAEPWPALTGGTFLWPFELQTLAAHAREGAVSAFFSVMPATGECSDDLGDSNQRRSNTRP